MKLEVTRDVVNDLWPLCRAGEASAASRTLVEEFLVHDAAHAATLKESEMLSQAIPSLRLSADAERRLLDDARASARTKLLVIGGAVAVGGLVLLTALGGALFVMLR